MSQPTKKPKKRPPPPPQKPVEIDISKEMPGADDKRYAGGFARKMTSHELIKQANIIASSPVTKVEIPGASDDINDVVQDTIKEFHSINAKSKAHELCKEIVVAENNDINDIDEKSPGFEWISRLAELTYVTHPGAISVSALLEMPLFKGKVSYGTLYRYCRNNNWVQKREEYFHGLQEQIKQKVATAQVQSRVEQLEKFNIVFENLFSIMKDVQPGTLEGVVGAMVRVGKFSEELRSGVCASIVPDNESEKSSREISPVQPILTYEEARAITKMVVEMRKNKKEESLKENLEETT